MDVKYIAETFGENYRYLLKIKKNDYNIDCKKRKSITDDNCA